MDNAPYGVVTDAFAPGNGRIRFARTGSGRRTPVGGIVAVEYGG